MRYQDYDQGMRQGQGMGRGNGNGNGGRDDYEMRGGRGGGQWQSQGQGGMQQGGMQQGRGRESRSNDRLEDEESNDAIVKVIEVVAQSERGWEDAVQRAVEHAARSVRNIKSVYVKDMTAVVRDDRVMQYRVVAKISFLLEGTEDRGRDRSHENYGRR